MTLRNLLTNKSFIFEIERRKKENPSFNISLNEKIKN